MEPNDLHKILKKLLRKFLPAPSTNTKLDCLIPSAIGLIKFSPVIGSSVPHTSSTGTSMVGNVGLESTRVARAKLPCTTPTTGADSIHCFSWSTFSLRTSIILAENILDGIDSARNLVPSCFWEMG